MKIYLAARYRRREEMQVVAGLLERFGHEVTSRWITGAHETGEIPDGGVGAEQAAHFAQEDLDDLRAAECVISFTEYGVREKAVYAGRGGRHAEFGMAVALDKRLVVIGPHEHVFHYLPQVNRLDHIGELFGLQGADLSEIERLFGERRADTVRELCGLRAPVLKEFVTGALVGAPEGGGQ